MNRQRFGRAGVALALAGVGLAIGATSALRGPAGHQAAHDGGTLKLTYQGASGIDRSAHQLHAAGLAARAGHAGRARQLQEGAGNAAYTVVPDLAVAIPKPTDGGKTLGLQAAPGHQVLERKVSSRATSLASFQRIFKIHGPTAASFYGSIVGAARA